MRISLYWFLPLFLGCCLWSAAEDSKTVIPAPTDAELERFGRELAQYVNDGEPAKMADKMDWEVFASRITRGQDLKGISSAEFTRHFASSWKKSLVMWKHGRFVRVSTVNGERRGLLRVISEDGAINFIDWVCAPNADGSIKTIDFFSYLTAELASDTVWHGLLPLFADLHKGFLERLTKGDSEFSRAMPKLKEALGLFRAGNATKAMNILEDLPEEVKVAPLCLLARLQVAQATGSDDAYLRVISEWEAARPGDPALDVISIDGHLMRKDYARCIHSIESLQKRVGADGYLQAMKANVHLMAGSVDQAHAVILEAVALEPDLMNSYEIWFGIELESRNWNGLVAALTKCETNFPKTDIWAGFEAEESWAPFRESAACKVWLEKRTENQPAVGNK